MFTYFRTKRFSLFAFVLLSAVMFTACGDDEDGPPISPPPVEVITDVFLNFIDTDGNLIVARAQDPDGEGAQDLQTLGEINLTANTTYALTIQLQNGLEDPAEDIAAEVAEEADEHQFFFEFSNNSFANPAGNGNIDTPSDPMVYLDMDDNGNPLGLITSWTTRADALSGGSFTIRLQHQPDIKTATTGAEDGDTDVEVTFVLNIQ